MSYEALNWAMNQPLKITTRSVLMELASHYNSDTKRCDPSIERLQGRLLTSHVTILKSIKELISLGLISRKKRGPLTAFYTLNFNVYVENTTNIDFIRTDQYTSRAKESLPLNDERTKDSLGHEVKKLYNKSERNFSSRTKESLPKTVIKPVSKTVSKTEPKSEFSTPKEKVKKQTGTVKKIPTLEQVRKYAKEKGYTFDPDKFFYYWDSIDWTRKSGQKIKNWKSAMAQWSINQSKYEPEPQKPMERKSALADW